MKPEEIAAYCMAKPGAYEDRPFGPVPVCYKVHGKIFVQLYPEPENYKITLKCTAFAGQMFRQAHPGVVTRGYHCPPVQQPYWNTVALNGFPAEELCYMMDHAYETVLEKLPQKVQQQILENESK